MREIKFKGLRVDGKGWVYGFLIGRINPHKEENEITDYWINDGCGSISQSVKVLFKSVGQLTPSKDKNGFDIYEGDIVRASLSFNDTFQDYVMEDITEINLTNSSSYEATAPYGDGEVIGNIHESKT